MNPFIQNVQNRQTHISRSRLGKNPGGRYLFEKCQLSQYLKLQNVVFKAKGLDNISP